ncbi:ATP-dependent sacrificial sulfur transferase LarE [Anaerobaca lacustris]|uniref:ATP-dependent sacrificial sulfur transferase LarE n=1 Tax=Anaerobaca lacustris TaxID=3044600 RepID=A0AAW6TX76_9BACT|nr:ATP-dependent sacrificial sulfur transferase LarE [Sedimentisphaerales bacterium M17dextr]
MTLQEKRSTLEGILRDLGRVVVAFSGGVDSSLLLKVAAETLGTDNVLACISAGASEPSHQLARAAALARDIGVELMTVETDELDDPNFVVNQADRCFHCKSHLCRTLLDIAAERGFEHVVFGTNYDDLDDFRPGNRAIAELGVRSPLAEAKLTKDDIRRLSRQFGLPTADMPSSPCLASRISYGLEVTAERLRQIDEAEAFLREAGFVEFRVRHHDEVARIEVPPAEITRLAAEPLRSHVVDKLKRIGFRYVALDLQGFRSGSLNEALSEQQKRASL